MRDARASARFASCRAGRPPCSTTKVPGLSISEEFEAQFAPNPRRQRLAIATEVILAVGARKRDGARQRRKHRVL